MINIVRLTTFQKNYVVLCTQTQKKNIKENNKQINVSSRCMYVEQMSPKLHRIYIKYKGWHRHIFLRWLNSFRLSRVNLKFIFRSKFRLFFCWFWLKGKKYDDNNNVLTFWHDCSYNYYLWNLFIYVFFFFRCSVARLVLEIDANMANKG